MQGVWVRPWLGTGDFISYMLWQHGKEKIYRYIYIYKVWLILFPLVRAQMSLQSWDSWIDKFCLDADVFKLWLQIQSTLMNTVGSNHYFVWVLEYEVISFLIMKSKVNPNHTLEGSCNITGEWAVCISVGLEGLILGLMVWSF